LCVRADQPEIWLARDSVVSISGVQRVRFTVSVIEREAEPTVQRGRDRRTSAALRAMIEKSAGPTIRLEGGRGPTLSGPLSNNKSNQKRRRTYDRTDEYEYESSAV
jgi:hypothetical protein